MAASENAAIDRFASLLPASHSRLRRKAVFKENELTTRFQNTSDTCKSLRNARDCAKSERADDSIDARILQGNAFSRQVQKFEVQLRLAVLSFCEPNHPWVGFESIEFRHFGGIVMSEIYAWTDTDLQDLALGKRDNSSTNFPNGWRVT
jgi:hypothetical protein